MNNSEMPKEIRAAFDEVRKYCPDTCMVLFSHDARWRFMNKDGQPAKWHPNINTSILENAADSLTSFPAFFYLAPPTKNKTPNDFVVGTFYKHAMFSGAIYFCAQSELGKHMILIKGGQVGNFCTYIPNDPDNESYWSGFTPCHVTLN